MPTTSLVLTVEHSYGKSLTFHAIPNDIVVRHEADQTAHNPLKRRRQREEIKSDSDEKKKSKNDACVLYLVMYLHTCTTSRLNPSSVLRETRSLPS